MERLDHTKARTTFTFSECAKHWLATVTPHMKPSSARRRETSVAQLFPYFGAVLIRNITASTCEAWAAKRSPGIAASTYNERDCIIAILNYAKREGLLLDNPGWVLRRRKLGKTSIVIPSRAEFEKLVATMRGFDVRYQDGANLIELLAYSGMRLAEATSALWRDIDFGNGRFTVRGGEFGTKNHEARVVPMFPAMRAFLERLSDATAPAADSRITPIDRPRKDSSAPAPSQNCRRLRIAACATTS